MVSCRTLATGRLAMVAISGMVAQAWGLILVLFSALREQYLGGK